MKKEMKNTKLGDMNISVNRVNKDSVVFELTGRENGFKTFIRLQKEQLEKLYDILRNHASIDYVLKKEFVINVRAKHREYIGDDKGSNFSYKYFETDNATIKMAILGGHCIISLVDETTSKVYRTTSFNCQCEDTRVKLDKLKDKISFDMCEYMMNEI